MNDLRNRITFKSPLIKQLQQRTVERFCARLRQMLDRIDDVFFSLADNASNNDHQNEYFQAMRQLRMQRGEIELYFKKLLIDGFLRLENGPNQWQTDNEAEEVLDVRLAVDEMTRRAREQYPAALLQLQSRLQLMMPENCAFEITNPLAPDTLCQAFEQSLRQLEVNLNPRLVLLKHFERDVLPELGPLLREALDILRSVGTPDQYPPRVNGTPARPPDYQRRDTLTANPFLQRLDQLQQQMLEQPPATHHTFLEWQHQIRQTAQNARQENAINMVFMLFEYLLDRQTLDARLATAFARLQIPVIRIALHEPTFFSDPSHPARRLLKTLAQATLGWEAHSDTLDPLPDALGHAITRMLHGNNEAEPLHFSDVEHEFLDAIAGQGHRLKRAGERIRASVSGRRVSQQARTVVVHLLEDRLQGKVVPEVFLPVITGPWSQWLQHCWQQYGNASPSWQKALKLTDDLIWSVQARQGEVHRLSWMKRLPQLVKDISEALSQKLAAKNRDAAVEALWLIHAAILKEDQRLLYTTVDFTNSEPARSEAIPLHEGQWLEWSGEGPPQRLQLARKGNKGITWLFFDRHGNPHLEAGNEDVRGWWQKGELALLSTGEMKNDDDT